MAADRPPPRPGSRPVERPTDHRGRFVPDGSWPPGRGAPDRLERVRRFVNTKNPESGADHFETSASLSAWLRREGYPAGPPVTAQDRVRVVEVREALRELAHANHESSPVSDEAGGVGPSTAHAFARLDEVAAERPVVVRLAPSPRLIPTMPGVDGVLASLLATVHDAMVAGTWGRMKACRNHHCRWVFYDHSKNGSGAWCSTAACGSRMKVRAYRARQRARGGPGGPPLRQPGGAMKPTFHALAAPTLAIGMLLGASACGNDGGGTSPAVPDGSFCDVVLAWSDGVVGTLNQFSRESPDVADVSARRALYLKAWDGLGDLSAWVDAAADRAPEATRVEIHGAADRVRDELAVGRKHAESLSDAAYEFASVQDGTLFTSTEKSRSLVYRTLDDLRGQLGDTTVPSACGRHTEPVTLPIMTAP